MECSYKTIKIVPKYNFLYVWRVINHITNKISVNPQSSPISPTYPYGSHLDVNGSIIMKIPRNNSSSEQTKWLKETYLPNRGWKINIYSKYIYDVTFK